MDVTWFWCYMRGKRAFLYPLYSPRHSFIPQSCSLLLHLYLDWRAPNFAALKENLDLLRNKHVRTYLLGTQDKPCRIWPNTSIPFSADASGKSTSRAQNATTLSRCCSHRIVHIIVPIGVKHDIHKECSNRGEGVWIKAGDTEHVAWTGKRVDDRPLN